MRLVFTPACLACLVAASIGYSAKMGGSTLTVDDDGLQHSNPDFTNIQAAIDAAVDGDTVLVYPGTYTNVGGHVFSPLGKAITIRGAGAREVTIIDGQNERTAVACYSGEGPSTVIEGLTITRGRSTNGGGGVRCAGSSPLIVGCEIRDNTAVAIDSYYVGGGGILCWNSNPQIRGCIIIGNAVVGTVHNPIGGGGIACFGDSTPTISDCTISHNVASTDGAGVRCEGGSRATITRCTISMNVVEGDGLGGGLSCHLTDGAIVSDSTLCGNEPKPLVGHWTDAGGNCIAFSCMDGNRSGCPDECEGPIGDGLHEVPNEYGTIQAAINAAGYGDTVLVHPGTHTGTGGWVIDTIGKPITIRASGAASETVLDGQSARQVVRCASGESPDTALVGLCITGGKSGNGGGGIHCFNSSPTIAGCTISKNHASANPIPHGGGIYCDQASPAITECIISGNWADAPGSLQTPSGGGIYCRSDSKATITQCTIEDNFLVNDGLNPSVSFGAGVRADSSSLIISDCIIAENHVFGIGGGGGVGLFGGNPTMSRCLISGNSALGPSSGIPFNGSGGGIYCSQVSGGTIEACTITRNSARVVGGGMSCYECSSLAIINCTISDNEVTISSSGLGGAGLALGNSSPTIFGCTVSGNNTLGLGGGIRCSASSPMISDCTVVGNSATGLWGSANGGGGIFCISGSNAAISRCTISDNSSIGLSWQTGGGVCANGDSHPTVSFSNICGNVPAQTVGPWVDQGENCVTASCAGCTCPGDLDSSASISGGDLSELLGNWGQKGNSPADLNGDGIVTGFDLGILLGNWGPCQH